MKRFRHWLWLTLAASTLLAGCGFHVLQGARDSFRTAKEAGAETKAPYDYYSAEAFLKIAEDEWIEGDWKATQDWATESTNYSDQALKAARGGGR